MGSVVDEGVDEVDAVDEAAAGDPPVAFEATTGMMLWFFVDVKIIKEC